MLPGARHGLRRLSFSQSPFDHATPSRNELFLPFLYPRESFSVLTQERYVRRSLFSLAVGNNRFNGSSSSNCCRHTSLNPHRTTRKYTAPPSASNVSDSTHASELGNHDNGGESKEMDTGASSVHDTCSTASDASSESSSEQSMDVFKEVEAIESNSSGIVRQVRAEKWWRKQLERELAGKPPLRQNRLYLEWTDIMNEIMALRRDTANIPAPSYAKTIYLSEPEVVALAGDERENVWDIRVLSGCRVHILPRERESRDSTRKVVLTGSPEAVRLAEEEIRSAIEMVHEADGSVQPDSLPLFVTAHDWKQEQGMDTPTIRSVWTHNVPLIAEGKRSRIPVRADAFRKPEKWTIKSFGDYLESLTNLAFSTSIHNLLYSDGQLNRDMIIDIIRELFTSPDMQQFLSTRAVNSVIFYCYRYPQYLPVLLSLFPNFEHLMTTRTFNALLTGCSKSHDLNRFRYLISLMKRCGVKPNGVEWVAFIDTILSTGVRQKVVARLRKERLLDNERILRRLVYRIIPDSFTSHLDSGQSVKDYIAVMDKRYGKNWICTDSITHMLGVTVRLHNTEAAREIMQFCKQSRLKLDVQGMNYCLAVHLNKKQYSETIAVYLDLISKYRRLRANNETIRILFSAAWQARHYNTCRVIWAYACFWGFTTSSMKHMVLFSLLRNTVPTMGDEARQDWLKKAGKAIAGINPIMSELDSRFDVLRNAPRTPAQEMLGSDSVMSLLTEYQPAGELRSRQRNLALWIIHGDFLAAWRYKPRVKFEEMMWEANMLDMAWWAEGHARNMSVTEIVRDVIRIPVDEKNRWKKRTKEYGNEQLEDEIREEQQQRQEEEDKEEEEEELDQQPQEPEQGPEGRLEGRPEGRPEQVLEGILERELERNLEQEQRRRRQQQDIKGKEEETGEGVNKDATIVSNARSAQPELQLEHTGHKEGWMGGSVSIDEVKEMFERKGISWKGPGSP
ncbi:hypothetical protein BDBG_02487 [Blastomyces gilchristii SLH14081]|uniref:K Homology domain-containing protein n=1 Tax=Blastomyces gilchristii (strain SLH14081) TaxID=559298 RepID=A0A179UDZ2_BLAGS|nr:uncharacterized protein BDBG_02487 [Blastomyces gilchristii SLH14081]OAT06236.1 hypothetical protein BDBG_02487 [Blastomyces gilchristii SLH14081]